MSPISKFTRLEIPYLLRNMTSVVAVVLNEQGNVRDCNRGFLYIAALDETPSPAWNARSLFVQPIFSTFTQVVNLSLEEPVYRGILTIGSTDQQCRSISGAVYRDNDLFLVIGEHDIADLERLSATVVELNEDLAGMQRELVNANRRLKRNEAKLKQLMMTDPLTNISNRRHYEEVAEQEIARANRYHQPLSLAIGDIDLFKSVNDTYGHNVGDTVIKAFADTFSQGIRASDHVARIGGEEFVILLPQTQAEEAILVIDRLRMIFGNLTYPEVSGPITASFGVTQLLPDDDLDSLMKRADDALYQAKNEGRNQTVLCATCSDRI